MSLVLVGVAVLALAVAHFLWVAERWPIVGPETLFLVMGLGTYAASAASSSDSSRPYVLFIGAGVAAFVGGTFASRWAHRFAHRSDLASLARVPWRDDLRGAARVAVLGLGIFSVLVTIAYFTMLGAYVPLEALESFLAGGRAAMIATYARLRAAATSSTGAYLGLGYVSQFKDVLVPLITLVLFFHHRLRPTPGRRAWLAVGAACTVLGTIGTGQRYHLAFFGAALLLLGMAPTCGRYASHGGRSESSPRFYWPG